MSISDGAWQHESQPRARELLAKGLTHEEIATALGINRRTVIRYLKAE